MNLKELILEKFESVDKFLNATDIQLSRTYLYRLLFDEEVNPSLAVIEELARVLEKSVDEIVKAIYSNTHRE